MDDEHITLAHEIFTDLKRTCRRRRRIIFLLSAVLILFAAILAASPTRIRTAGNGENMAAQRVIMKEFTEPECERFRNLCNFTEEERAVFDLRVKGKSNVDISMRLNMSESTVERRVRSVKRKIIKVL